MIIGIDASRIRSGGGVAHIKGIIKNFQSYNHSISKVHIWSYRKLLDDLPTESWLVKHSNFLLNKSLSLQIIWQLFLLDRELKNHRCDILFSLDASTFCFFDPMVVLSQDLLSYEPNIMSKYGFGLKRLRLILILFLQNAAFRRSAAVLFLSKYASNLIQKSSGIIKNFKIIPHGIDQCFIDRGLYSISRDYKCNPKKLIYISNAAPYKNQLQVIEAVNFLIKNGYDLSLNLIGGGHGKYQKLLSEKIQEVDPGHNWLKQYDFVNRQELFTHLSNADIFIFASSCENLPVTLLEGMAFSLPIVCSDRGPMPDVLKDGGLYFDPDDIKSLVNALEQIIESPFLRTNLSNKARSIACKYTWERCSFSSFKSITQLLQNW